MGAGGEKQVALPVEGVLHGAVDAAAGDQGQEGHQQVAGHRALAYPGHPLGIGGEKHGRPEGLEQIAVARQRAHQQIDQPGQPSADGADDHAGGPDVEDDAKAQTGGKGRQAGDQVVGKAHLYHPPDQTGQGQGQAGAQGDACGGQQGLGQLDEAGDQVPGYDVPHKVGDNDAGDQGHDGAGDDEAGVLAQADHGERHRQQGADKAAGDGLEELVGAQPGHEQQAGPDGQPAQAAAQGVPQGAPEEEAEGGGAQGVAEKLPGGGKLGAVGQDPLQPDPGLIQVGDLLAQAAAQVVEGLHAVDVGAVAGDAADHGEGPLPRSAQADDQTVGDGEYLAGVHAVGAQQVADGLLHPVDLRPAHHQSVAQLPGQGEQLVVIQRAPALLPGGADVRRQAKP